MSKVAKQNQSAKLVVDFYTECADIQASLPFGVLTCQCYIPGDESESYIEKEVRMSELYDFVKGDKNKVWVTGNDHENTAPVDFYDWYSNMRMSVEMNSLLSDLINRKEKRTSMMDLPDIFGALGKILKPEPQYIDHILQITGKLD